MMRPFRRRRVTVSAIRSLMTKLKVVLPVSARRPVSMKVCLDAIGKAADAFSEGDAGGQYFRSVCGAFVAREGLRVVVKAYVASTE